MYLKVQVLKHNSEVEVETGVRIGVVYENTVLVQQEVETEMHVRFEVESTVHVRFEIEN
jgi:hypothetical protein